MVDEELLWNLNTSSVSRQAAATFPHWGRLTAFCAFNYSGGVCSRLLQCKSQRLEPLAGSIGLLALVHTTRLTGGYDFKSIAFWATVGRSNA